LICTSILAYSTPILEEGGDHLIDFDGETLLCLTKAARHLGYQHLVPVIQKAIRAMAETYTVDAWRRNPDSRQTKGFYQWGSMAFAEYYQARWQGYELYGDVTLALAWWMIHTHETLSRRRNHAYALEGLISAYTIAKHRNDEAALTGLLFVIDQSLDKLTRWQVGGPLAEQNAFLAANPTEDPMALGGVMNAAGPDPRGKRRASDTQHELRIDVTQHQMHAVMLALEHVYQDSKPAMEQR
jgi:hypothetical protein